jgi:hypothetical protein
MLELYAVMLELVAVDAGVEGIPFGMSLHRRRGGIASKGDCLHINNTVARVTCTVFDPENSFWSGDTARQFLWTTALTKLIDQPSLAGK